MTFIDHQQDWRANPIGARYRRDIPVSRPAGLGYPAFATWIEGLILDSDLCIVYRTANHETRTTNSDFSMTSWGFFA